MKPILLIHGYSSEGRKNTPAQIYGTLPQDLREAFGDGVVREINLSRWISLSDGIRLDDVSLAMDRALRLEHASLLQNGFHVITHSTGALVVRNWIRLFSEVFKPSPIENIIHLAGANFGSGLAHIGQGQLARWGRLIFGQTGRGLQILHELEFGCWKTLDLHIHFRSPGNDMRDDYQVQEFVLAGSQTLPILRPVPIRYVKEDSADNTVRTAAANLNFTYVRVQPSVSPNEVSLDDVARELECRLSNAPITLNHYDNIEVETSRDRPRVPFTVLYETAHFGDKIGIVSGPENRKRLLPLIRQALETPFDPAAYQRVASEFDHATGQTLRAVARLKNNILNWNRQRQYEAHAQVIFRLRDQTGGPVREFDVTFRSFAQPARPVRLESRIEDTHRNEKDGGSITFYFRVTDFQEGEWRDQTPKLAPVHFEITAIEPDSGEIHYLPLTIRLSGEQVEHLIRPFETTVVDITLLRLPSAQVFQIEQAPA